MTAAHTFGALVRVSEFCCFCVLCLFLECLLTRAMSPAMVQVDTLNRRGIRAACISSAETAAAREEVLQSIMRPKQPTVLLYVTAEMLATPHFQQQMKKLNVIRRLGLIAIDEAHCVSTWGHEFRPKYREVRRNAPREEISSRKRLLTF